MKKLLLILMAFCSVLFVQFVQGQNPAMQNSTSFGVNNDVAAVNYGPIKKGPVSLKDKDIFKPFTRVLPGDATAPIVLTKDITVALDNSGNATITAAKVDNGSSDNSGTVYLNINKTSFNCADIGSNSVTLTATDPSGNSATGIAEVTVVDDMAPTIIGKPISVALTANGTVVIVPDDLLLSGTDNCGTITYTINQNTFDIGDLTNSPITIQLTGTDQHNNSTTVPVQVTLLDPVPNAICRSVTMALDKNGTAAITPGQIDNGSNSTVGIINLTLDKKNFDCSNVGNNTVVLTVTSLLGSTATCAATVTIFDQIAPKLTVPANIVRLNNAGVCGAVVNIGQATATDNCSVASVTNDAPAFFPVGVTTITWTAVDVNGNTTTGTQTVEITNNAPVIRALTVSPLAYLGDATVASAIHADNNLAAATWNWDDGSSTPGVIAGTQLSGNHIYSQTGSYDVTLTIVDACGKSDTKIYSYVVICNPCNGFITGGGYIMTTTGAYTANPALTDKSKYEFEAKYHKGDVDPKGEFQFEIHSANFKVKSSSLDWLMVNNDQAILKGSATVNGQDGYQFIASMLDGNIVAKNGTDYLRLIVWDNAGNILYDNQNGDLDNTRATNPIDKGQIVIHKSKNGNCDGYEEDDEHESDNHNDDTNENHDKVSEKETKSGSINVVLSPDQIEMTVYPNPVSNDEVTISIENFGNTQAKVDLTNLSGQLVYSVPSVRFSSGRAKIDFQQADLKPGNYLLRVTEISSTSRFGVKQITVSNKK